MPLFSFGGTLDSDGILLAGLLLALGTGGLLVVVGMVVAAKLLRPVIREATAEARDATDRLVQAHRDGFQIPHREEAPPERVIEVLPETIEEFVSQFDEAGQAIYRTKARSLLDSGGSEQYVHAQLGMLRARRNDGFVT